MRRGITIVPLLIAAIIIGFQYCGSERFKNPETGRVAHVALSTQDEAALGLQSYQEVLSESELVTAGPEYEQVVRVARRLAPATGESGRGFQWEVSVVRSRQMNAFCLPGGKIVVYTGILPITRSDSGLATVMGHEMAHAVSRHGSQRLFQNSVTQTALMGASLSFGNMDPQKRQMVMAALGAGAQYGILLPFSREHETEADEIGLIYMARAGFDPRESIDFWQRMEDSGGRQPPEFASTHPSHGTRIRRLQEAMPRAIAEFEKARSAR